VKLEPFRCTHGSAIRPGWGRRRGGAGGVGGRRSRVCIHGVHHAAAPLLLSEPRVCDCAGVHNRADIQFLQSENTFYISCLVALVVFSGLLVFSSWLADCFYTLQSSSSGCGRSALWYLCKRKCERFAQAARACYAMAPLSGSRVGAALAVADTPCPEAATRCPQAVLFGLASTQALVAACAEALARGVPALQGRAAVLPLVGPVPAPVLAALPAGIAVTCAWGGLQVPPKQRTVFLCARHVTQRPSLATSGTAAPGPGAGLCPGSTADCQPVTSAWGGTRTALPHAHYAAEGACNIFFKRRAKCFAGSRAHEACFEGLCVKLLCGTASMQPIFLAQYTALIPRPVRRGRHLWRT